MTCNPKVFKLDSPTWQKIRKEKGSTSLTLLSDQSICIQYWILSSRFSLVFKSTRTFGSILFSAIHHPCLLSIWSHIIHISTSSFHWGSPLPRPRSARDVVGSKQPPSQGYLAHSKCLCKESTGLIVFLCQSICYLPGANLLHIFHNMIHTWKLYKWYIRIDIIKKFHDFWNHLSTR